MDAPVAALRAALEAGEPAILVTVAKARGSTPREAGAAMVVTAARAVGTVGGGALEMEGIAEARRLLAAGEAVSKLDIPLGPAIGQCCGGRVVLDLARASPALLAQIEAGDAAAKAAHPSVLVFGAGHTGQALARALAPLPLRTLVIDPRADRLADLPPGTARRQAAIPEAEVAAASAGSAFVVATHDHALDFLIASAALARPDAAYVGMIGSATKRESFRRHLAGEGRAGEIDRLVLPIGGAAIRDKRPEVIAALVAAELLVTFAYNLEENRCTGFAPVQSQCNKLTNHPRWTEPHAATS
ncbi:xanthine dehydrogenase accessory protein XdhC [Aureimonas pseudogalii]|uniref:Xanthine dehydrogenase accessory protein XdhC n=1 Tax=Aureimonas pseudogalii TaxID=1744844 RepID=A0A7W6E9T1_9HYPH|nr:xanthine dehydrogenase accessory protein XdhC [Aureimonas pseudogalii]MBB3997358.1 xanthine dehydrogenase accessory protein XdhC [Aureimonas pseudogalii]